MSRWADAYRASVAGHDSADTAHTTPTVNDVLPSCVSSVDSVMAPSGREERPPPPKKCQQSPQCHAMW
jgi:hypothetical protein